MNSVVCRIYSLIFSFVEIRQQLMIQFIKDGKPAIVKKPIDREYKNEICGLLLEEGISTKLFIHELEVP